MAVKMSHQKVSSIMEVRELTDEEARRTAVPILRQLWSTFTPQEVMKWTAREDYHLLGGFIDDELAAVAGVVIPNVLHHVRHAWLYDLVVDEPKRGGGFGSELVEAVERWAAERDCEYVALASPVGKDGVHQFYSELGYQRSMYVIEKQL